MNGMIWVENLTPCNRDQTYGMILQLLCRFSCNIESYGNYIRSNWPYYIL